MKIALSFGVFDFIMFAGALQGILLSWVFFGKKNRQSRANLYQGMLILALSLAITEEFLNNTGLITKVISIANFAESFNLAYGPLLLLYLRRSQNPKVKDSKELLHLLPAFLYIFYMGFFFFQPDAVKFNAYIYSKFPAYDITPATTSVSPDPLGIRQYINLITAIHLGLYLALSVKELWFKRRTGNKQMLKAQEPVLNDLKVTALHFVILALLFATIKITFINDVGDYFITTYVTIMFFYTSFRLMYKSDSFESSQSFLSVPVKKYSKSSLTERQKEEILQRVHKAMSEDKFFTSNLASMSRLANRLDISKHSLSQVVNEKKGMSFYELLASYRIEEAKKMLADKDFNNFTIEEIAERVGYNSKSSFHTAFKKETNTTPMLYRKRQKES